MSTLPEMSYTSCFIRIRDSQRVHAGQAKQRIVSQSHLAEDESVSRIENTSNPSDKTYEIGAPKDKLCV